MSDYSDYSPYKKYPNRIKCSTCQSQDVCERIESFNNDGCEYHTKWHSKGFREKPQELFIHKLNNDIHYLNRVRYTGISRVEI